MTRPGGLDCRLAAVAGVERSEKKRFSFKVVWEREKRKKNYNDDIENIFIIITLIVYLSTFWHGFTKPGEILLSVLAIP